MRSLLIAIAFVAALLGGPVSAGFIEGSAYNSSSPSQAPASLSAPDSSPVIMPSLTEVRIVYAGWNFAAWPMEGCQPIVDALGNLAESNLVNVVAIFSPKDQTWRLFDPDAPGGVNTLNQFCKGDISVLNVREQAEWVQEAPVTPADAPPVATSAYSGPLSVGAQVKVANTDGDCLNVRSAPAEQVLTCLPQGSAAMIDYGPTYINGYWWWHLQGLGWAAGDFLELNYGGPLRVGISVKVANTDGTCLNVRAEPNGEVKSCLRDGHLAAIDSGPVYDGDHWWWRLAGLGWSAGDYLQPVVTTAGVGGGDFIWPVRGSITDGFGVPRGSDYHRGIDIDVPEGSKTLVLSAAGGKVVEVGNNWGWGNYVVVDHGNGFKTVYAHLSSAAVEQGRVVNQGAVLGYTGCTGWCIGEHLHFEIHKDGVPVDPAPYLTRPA